VNIKERIKRINFKKIIPISLIAIFVTLLFIGIIYYVFKQNKDLNSLKASLAKKEQELTDIVSEDPYKTNKDLQDEIKNIHDNYSKTVSVYEDLIYFRESTKKLNDLDSLFAQILNYLSEKNYSSASATINVLSQKIKDEQTKTATAFIIPENINSSNTPPTSGYSRQTVQTDIGSFMVSLISADTSSTKIIVDTASDSDCSNDCPVMSLSSYISRSGAFAGVNGSYFCPASYPTCAGKTNSFDTLLMNKNKTYFNSANNVYSTNPAVIFGSGYIRFVRQSQEWGRDTSIDSMISNYPLLVIGNDIQFSGDNDPKKGSKGARSFIANKGNSVFIGVVHNATVAESAYVMKSLGMENALNLDNGGSTALWSGGYKVGPGRDLPNAILFVKK
jgi:exopolysaccharide biosynthesis protein